MRCAAFLALAAMLVRSQSLPESIRFQQGPAWNTVLIGDTTAVYGATSAKVTRVLFWRKRIQRDRRCTKTSETDGNRHIRVHDLLSKKFVLLRGLLPTRSWPLGFMPFPPRSGRFLRDFLPPLRGQLLHPPLDHSHSRSVFLRHNAHGSTNTSHLICRRPTVRNAHVSMSHN